MKKLLDIAAEIVQAQASVGQMSAEQIEQSLIKTFSTLQKMQRAEEKGIFLDRGTAEEIGAEEAQAKESRANPFRTTRLFAWSAEQRCDNLRQNTSVRTASRRGTTRKNGGSPLSNRFLPSL